MKRKLKFIILSILALLFIACTGTNPGGNNGGGTPPLELITVMGNDVFIGNQNDIMTKDISWLYDRDKIENLDEDFESKKLNIRPNINLYFEADEKDIKFKGIENNGNMYFDAKRDKEGEYLIAVGNKDFYNYNKIVVNDGNKGSTLKINGNYYAGEKSRIVLGLYAKEKGKEFYNEFYTDRFYITGDVKGTTKVDFIYNKNEIEKLDKNATNLNSAIVVKGNVQESSFEMEPAQKGLHMFELKYHAPSSYTDLHRWRLEMKK